MTAKSPRTPEDSFAGSAEWWVAYGEELRECQDTRPSEGVLLVDHAEVLEHCDVFKDTPEAIQEQRMRSGGEVMVFEMRQLFGICIATVIRLAFGSWT